MKTDNNLLVDVFESFLKVTTQEYGINTLFCVSLCSDTYQCRLEYTGNNLQELQDKNMIFLKEKNIRGGISSVVSDRYVKSNENTKIL